MSVPKPKAVDELPPDNATRLAIFDVLHDAAQAADEGAVAGLTEDELFARVISRLRVLVPRELHVAGEKTYLQDKIQVCLDAGIVASAASPGGRILTVTDQPPQIRHPGAGQPLRTYPAGLELARERLDRDNERLRTSKFDVRRHVPSIATEPDSRAYRVLVQSMRDHGFLRQFAVVKYSDGVIVDGYARCQAATELGLEIEYARYISKEEGKAANRIDTPLNRVLIAINSNAARLTDDLVSSVHDAVAAVTGRPWEATSADLDSTQEWRFSTGKSYTPMFDVTLHRYRPGDDPKIQVDPDGKVMLRSLIQAAGLAPYKIDDLGPYVPFEQARTALSGRSAFFARAEDLVDGIARLQDDRRTNKRKPQPEWDRIREWLIAELLPGARQPAAGAGSGARPTELDGGSAPSA